MNTCSSHSDENNLQILQLKHDNMLLEIELLKQKNEYLKNREDRLESLLTATTSKLLTAEDTIRSLQSQISILFTYFKTNFECIEEELEYDTNESLLIANIIANDNEVYSLDILILLIERINSTKNKEPYVLAINKILQNSPSYITTSHLNLWDIINDGLFASKTQLNTSLQTIATITTMLYDVPLTTIKHLCSLFQSTTTTFSNKSTILLIFSQLEKPEQFQLISLITKSILEFITIPSSHSDELYGPTTIIIFNILNTCSENLMKQICVDVVCSPLWKIDFGTEWRSKNNLDPHRLIVTLFRFDSIRKLLNSITIDGLNAITYISRYLQLRSIESIEVLYELVTINIHCCISLLKELIKLYPFANEVKACVLARDVFEVVLEMDNKQEREIQEISNHIKEILQK
ncbi:Uncharacterized protein QTN25_008561 [Entamoeba marina]